MINIKILFLFALHIPMLQSLTCTNKTIFVNGVVEVASKPFYRTLTLRYSAFRQSRGINVTVRYVDKGGASLSKGLVGPVGSPPAVFLNTPYVIPQHDSHVEFPFFARAIVMVYNLPGINNLNLTLRGVSGIYLGRIRNWNDSRITKYNPNAIFPDQEIITVARMESDTSTAFITKIFDTNDPGWNMTLGANGLFSSPKFVGGICCKSTTWPVTKVFGNDTVGVVGIVISFPYTIGYVAKEAASQYSVSIAGILKVNESIENVVLPTVGNVNKAMYDFINDSDPDDFQLNSDTVYNDVSSYPLSAFSSIVLNYSYDDSSIDCCTIQELVGFIDWFYSDSNDEYIKSLGFISIISDLTDRIKRLVLSEIQCRGQYVYPEYLATLIDSKDSTTTIGTGQIVLIAAVSVLAVIAVLLFVSYLFYHKQNKNDESRWLIDQKRIKIKQRKQSLNNNDGKSDEKSCLSLDTLNLNQNINNTSMSVTKSGERVVKLALASGEMDGLNVYLNPLICKVPQQWSSDTKKMMNKFKNVLCRHVATLLGVTTIGPAPYSVYEYCAKGTLHYVLKTTRHNLTEDIKFHFALDTADGLKYLHRSGIVHGFLSSITCYVDSSWVVKLACWEQLSLYQKENTYQMKEELTYTTESLVDKAKFIQMIYIDPDLLMNVHTSADVFSFGFLLLEIFTRKLPYSDDVDGYQETYPEILQKKFTRDYIVQPMFQNLHADIINIFNACIVTPKQKRLNMIQIEEELRKVTRVASIGIVDIVLDTLEKHADALEDKVEERTAELKKVTEDMRNLLNEVLPPQIAAQLLAGNTVLPEQFECVTIYFSDIVGFTNISAMSLPMDVMTLLNDLWTVFDKIIEKFDVYKVDTIGDAYMVCSGLPIKNEMNHCKQIALLSLALREKCSRFKIKHLPDYPLNVRIGINSGPVTAGVVGSKMPQYCVFGDTVNTAARMESTSVPQKIQITERSYNLLNEHFPNTFEMVYRGEISVKGKGNMRTYWLLEQVRKN